MTDNYKWLELSGHTTPGAEQPDHDLVEQGKAYGAALVSHADTIASHEKSIAILLDTTGDIAQDVHELAQKHVALARVVSVLSVPVVPPPPPPVTPPAIDLTPRLNDMDARIKSINVTMTEVLKKTLFDQQRVQSDANAAVTREHEINEVYRSDTARQLAELRARPMVAPVPAPQITVVKHHTVLGWVGIVLGAAAIGVHFLRFG